MFILLTRLLLWLLVGGILWFIFLRFIPRIYLTWLGGLLLFSLLALAFVDPANSTIGLVWTILSIPLKPLGLAILLLLSALREGTRKVLGNQVLAALLVLLLSSLPIVAYWLTGQAEQSIFRARSALQEGFSLTQPADPQTVRAIVVLGQRASQAGGTAYRTQTQIAQEAGDTGVPAALVPRILYAGELYREQRNQGNDPLVIISAGPRPERAGADVGQADEIRDLLIDAGVASDRILIDSAGIDIYSSARSVRDMLVNRGFETGSDRVILVSSAISARRAILTFAQLGVRTTPRPTDFFVARPPDTAQLAVVADLIPSVEALELTTRVVEEYLTSIYYFLRGWLIDPLGF